MIRGELGDSSTPGVIRVMLSGENTCADATVTVYRKERWSQFSTTGSLLIVGASGIATAFAAMGIYSLAPRPASLTTDRAVGEVIGWAGLGLGLGLGLLPAALLRRDLPAGTESDEQPGLREVRPLPVQGPLSSSRRDRSWALAEGQLDLELQTLHADDLESASVNGIHVTWSSSATARLAGLDACRRSLEGWSPAQSNDCRRFDDALRCAEARWGLADPLLAVLRAECVPAPAADAGSHPIPPPTALPPPAFVP